MRHFVGGIVIVAALLLPFSVAAEAPTSTPSGSVYVVEAGDWLSTIAARLLGDATRYPEIVQATNARAQTDGDVEAIADPDRIEIGQSIWVPAAEEPAATQSTAAERALEPDWAYKGFAPSATCCGRDITLFLYIEGEAHLKTDFMNGEAPIIADGTWQVEGQTVIVTLTGQQGEDYAEPKVLRMTIAEDSLVPENELPTMTSFPAMAWEQLVPPYAGDDIQTRFATDGYVGIYKNFWPSASCCGQDITLYLNADGTILQVTDYMNDEDVLSEVGAWEADEAGVTVTLTGMQGQTPYDTPATIRLLPQDGVLVSQETTPEAIGYHFYAIEGLAMADQASTE